MTDPTIVLDFWNFFNFAKHLKTVFQMLLGLPYAVHYIRFFITKTHYKHNDVLCRNITDSHKYKCRIN